MGHSNLKNAIIAILVPLPSILFYLHFLVDPNGGAVDHPRWKIWCYNHPLLFANLLFFFNIDLLFWIIGFLLSSHWMIDLYWTVIPVLLVHYYATHPLAQFNVWRSTVVILLTWLWSLRLTHNYFRRENWEWGAREDWRFTDMRQQYGKQWWWVSFFAVYLSQQVFLVGVCLPLYVIHSVDEPWNIWDSAALFICICGIIIAYFADTQLYEFVSQNNKLKAVGSGIVPNLEEGLWKYSRHPNYFGEQLWWWGLGIFAWNLGFGCWSFIGALINSMCLGYVTILVEDRMLKRDYRRGAYTQYQKTTSVWIPWFKSSFGGDKLKNN